MTDHPTAKAETQRLQAIMYQALTEPVGLLLRSNAPDRARQRLYAARQGLPDLMRLQIRLSPFPDGDLVLIKNTAPTATKQGSKTVSPDLAVASLFDPVEEI